jgi:hypothetical protein
LLTLSENRTRGDDVQDDKSIEEKNADKALDSLEAWEARNQENPSRVAFRSAFSWQSLMAKASEA